MTADQDIDSLIAEHRRRAELAARPAAAMTERAHVYQQLYQHSGRNLAFALIAGHGALWGHRYFSFARKAARFAALPEYVLHRNRRTVIKRTHALIDGLSEINRSVCAETLFVYSVTADPRLQGAAETLFAPELLRRMQQCHRARLAGQQLNQAERRALYDAFFAWDQEYVVTTRLAQVYDNFDCRIVDWFAIRPPVRFVYFRRTQPMIFCNFLDVDERIAKGRLAYERAVDAGWDFVDATLVGHAHMNGLAAGVESALSQHYFPALVPATA